MMRFGFGGGSDLDRWFTREFFVCVAMSLIALSSAPANALPPGQQPSEQDIANDPTHKYGESGIAVNPTNPDNMVTAWVQDSYTLTCVATNDPICVPLLPTHIIGLPISLVSPPGYFTVPRFVQNGIFVTFNHGQSWQHVVLPLFPPDHPEFINQGDAHVTAGPDGAFYSSWDALNWSDPNAALPNGGIAVSKSTDGGLTWSDPVLVGTAQDGPKMTADLSNGRIYESSTGAIGRLATGNPSDPLFPPNSPTDRYVVATNDGVTWTTPHGFGGSNGTSYFAGSGMMSAANGELAVAFRSTSAGACSFFAGTAAPCVVFQTTADDGVTWSRHAVPAPDLTVPTGGNAGAILVAADPSTPGHFTIAGLTASGRFHAYQTSDSGATWSSGAMTTDGAPFTKWHPWMAYSPTGTLGIMWRASQAAGPMFSTPFLVWTTISSDGGATFATPLQVSAAASPPNPPGTFDAAGDDYSGLAFGQDRLFVSWADRRGPGGERAPYVATIKLSAFNH
jgi:hypothetical protein